MRAVSFLGLAVAVAVAACTAGGPSPSPSPSPSPEPSPSPSPAAAGFSIEVTPPEEPPEVRMAIPGQHVSFLVVVTDAAGGTDPVTISATATGATIGPILPESLAPGVVGEVWVVPDPSTVETTASLTITATRGSVTQSVDRTIKVFPMAGERAEAQQYFDLWTGWLATAHPELGITADTEWDPQFVSTLLVVSHYAYFSEDWEMTIAWHVMVAPYDWTEVHLRQRGVDVRPSLAYKIDSVSGGTEPYEIEPPEVVVR